MKIRRSLRWTRKQKGKPYIGFNQGGHLPPPMANTFVGVAATSAKPGDVVNVTPIGRAESAGPVGLVPTGWSVLGRTKPSKTGEGLTVGPGMVFIAPKPPKTLAMLQAEVAECNKAHGWFDSDRTFGDDLALIMSELGEALDAYRRWGFEDATAPVKPWPRHKRLWYWLQGKTLPKAPLPKPEGVGSEIADVLVRILDTCYRHDIVLQDEFDRKLSYNWTRPYRHGGRRL